MNKLKGRRREKDGGRNKTGKKTGRKGKAMKRKCNERKGNERDRNGNGQGSRRNQQKCTKRRRRDNGDQKGRNEKGKVMEMTRKKERG